VIARMHARAHLRAGAASTRLRAGAGRVCVQRGLGRAGLRRGALNAVVAACVGGVHGRRRLHDRQPRALARVAAAALGLHRAPAARARSKCRDVCAPQPRVRAAVAMCAGTAPACRPCVQDPLLIADGEVGDESSDEDEDGGFVAAAAAAAGEGAGGVDLADGGAPGAATAAEEGGARSVASGELQLRAEWEPADEGAEQADEEARKAAAAAAEDAARQAQVMRDFDEKRSPLAHVTCKICYERPVQVALVPCGHSNLCRHCARRVEFCPFCRKPVVRRQRLYLADS
jgi:Zinc finger, C3HC4 type (RING finger)